MENKTLTRFALMGVDGEIVEKLRTKIKDRTPNLTIEADGDDESCTNCLFTSLTPRSCRSSLSISSWPRFRIRVRFGHHP